MKKILIVTALAAMLLAACSKEEGGTDLSGPRSIVIDPTLHEMSKTTASVQTRATDVDFETDDAIGLSITMAADASSFMENARFSYTNGKFTSDDKLIWYEDIGLKSKLVAYYPYAAAVPTEFTVKSDQTGANYTLSDLMIATKEDVTPTVDATNMTFYHQLTKLIININNQSGGEITAVTIKGTVPTATVDIPNKTVAVKEGVAAADIQANVKTANTQYYAIVVPQTVAPQLAVTVNVGGVAKTLTQTYKQIDMLKGRYTVAIAVGADKIDVVMTGDIEDWTDNGALDPSDEVPFEEFDSYFMYNNERYALVTMKDGRKWMAENLRYVPKGVTVSTDPTDNDAKIWAPYTSDGTTCTPVTDPTEVAKSGYLYAVETALGAEITPENSASFEGVRGICPKGWHIPTQAEWIGLVGKTNKTAAGEDLTDITAPYYDATYAGGKISTMNTDGFNFTRAGVRMRSTIAGPGSYMMTIYPKPGSELSVNYLMCSTLYKNIYSTTDVTQLTNIQYFSPMTLYSATTSEGKLSVGYLGYKSGCPVRCIKDAASGN